MRALRGAINSCYDQCKRNTRLKLSLYTEAYICRVTFLRASLGFASAPLSSPLMVMAVTVTLLFLRYFS